MLHQAVSSVIQAPVNSTLWCSIVITGAATVQGHMHFSLWLCTPMLFYDDDCLLVMQQMANQSLVSDFHTFSSPTEALDDVSGHSIFKQHVCHLTTSATKPDQTGHGTMALQRQAQDNLLFLL